MQKTISKNKTSLIQVRLDNETKSSVERVLDSLGITTSQAVLMYLKQIVLKQKIPLDISVGKNFDDSNMNQSKFRKVQSNIIKELDKGETIPEINENNSRTFTF
jgi:addiction module RelB/DinJ family antitoxin